MEFLTILLASLLGLASPTNLVLETLGENAIGDRLSDSEQLEIRIDNTPNYQIIQGKIDRIRLASRGLWLTPQLRIAVFEMETDPLEVNVQTLRARDDRSPRSALERPIQAGVRVVLTEADLNQALRSPEFIAEVRQQGLNFLSGTEAEQLAQRYSIVNPSVEFLGDNRFRFAVEIEEQGYTDRLKLSIESGVSIVGGRQLQLMNPLVVVNDNPAPAIIANAIANVVTGGSDLKALDSQGIQARILQLNITPDQLELAAFVRVAGE